MKKNFLFQILFVCVSLSGYGQKEKQILDAEYIEKSVVKISENLFACKYETNNWVYRQFLKDLLANKKKEEYQIAMVYTEGWLKQPVYIASLAKLYHSDKQYDEFPVVNVSYDAAVLFCEWLSMKYNSFPGRKYKKVQIRLPNEEEWMKAAKGKNLEAIYPTGIGLKNKHGVPMANYKRTDLPPHTDPNTPDPEDILMLAPVKSYWPCSFGIYNMAGNAAEMIAPKGMTKGGGFVDSENSLFLESHALMENAASHIGFRYFFKVLP